MLVRLMADDTYDLPDLFACTAQWYGPTRERSHVVGRLTSPMTLCNEPAVN